ncbi:unnamed protein product [Linum trigynum]|uniref:Pectinesterase n=2 Tax=Linum trigynum TaxID=586398 RepID=A0AAV2EHP7_9ROSI
MMSKRIGPALCLILIHAAAVAIAENGHNSTLIATRLTVARMCASTDYKQACEETLRPVNATNDPKEFIKAAITATIEATERSFNLSAALTEKINIGRRREKNTTAISGLRMALEDCRDLLSDAVSELQESLSFLANSSSLLTSRANNESAAADGSRHVITELQNWLSAVVSYQYTCLDHLIERSQKLKLARSNSFGSVMKGGLGRATRLTSNALSMVNEIARSLDLVTSLGRTQRDHRKGGRKHLMTTRRRRGRRMLDEGFSFEVVVAQDGSGQFTTISEALAAYDREKVEDTGGYYVVYVKEGVYKEHVTVKKDQRNVFMFGDGARRTIVSGNRSNRDGFRTMKTATFEALGPGFIAQSMGFENTAGPEGHQAVALRVQGDKSAFIDCAIDGYQDSLYCHAHRQFYHNCEISGTIDFIFGYAAAVIQNSVITIRRPIGSQQNAVIAQGRAIEQQTTGIVLQNCRIVAEDGGVPPSYLGRPWKAYSRAVVMESEIGGVIRPEGWMPWLGDLYLDTLCFEEYGNSGAGAATGGRVKWKGFRVVGKDEAVHFTPGEFIQGEEWLDEKIDGKISFGLSH